MAWELGADPWLIFRTAILAAGVYAWTVFVLRLSGNRTVAQMRAFDFVVNVAMGTLVGSSLVTPSVPFALALTGIAALAAVQTAVASLAARSHVFSALVTNPPRVVFHDGRFLPDALRSANLTREDVLAAVRRGGRPDMEEVGAVILEANGELSVLPRGAAPGGPPAA